MADEKQKIINQVDANGSILGDLDDKWKSDKEVTFDSSGNSYVNKNISYTKENIADLVISLMKEIIR